MRGRKEFEGVQRAGCTARQQRAAAGGEGLLHDWTEQWWGWKHVACAKEAGRGLSF